MRAATSSALARRCIRWLPVGAHSQAIPPPEHSTPVLRSKPTPPRQIVASLPRDLERLILRRRRKDPERRYQTMLDVRNELQEIEQDLKSGQGLPLAAVPPSIRAAPWIAVGVVLLLVAATSIRRPCRTTAPPAVRVFPVTSLEGHDPMPTLSPDGSEVAFAWDGDKQSGNVDIHMALIGSPTVRRVTTEPAIYVFPSWSPDGRHVAFVRQLTDHVGHVYIMSRLGGDERKLSDFDVHFDRVGSIRPALLVARRPVHRGGAIVHPEARREHRHLSPPGAGWQAAPGDANGGARERSRSGVFAGRPSARVLLVRQLLLGRLRCHEPRFDQRSRLRLETPRRLTSLAIQMEGAAWARDGRTVVFGSDAAGFQYLWRVDAEGRLPPERLEMAGLGARAPATMSARDQLVFSRSRHNEDIYQPWLRRRSPTDRDLFVFGSSWPVFSPDGRRVAYCSPRSGKALDVWVARSDGSDARQLTQGLSESYGPSWAPSGRTLVFTSVVGGQIDIWTVDIDGGNLRQLTTGPGSRRYPVIFERRCLDLLRQSGTAGLRHLAHPIRWRPGAAGHAGRWIQGLRDDRRQEPRVSARGGPRRSTRAAAAACRRIAARTRQVRVRLLGLGQGRLLLPVRFERPACAAGSATKDRRSTD